MVDLNDENLQMVAKVVGGTLVATVTAYVIWKKFRKPTRKEYPRDMVIHHQLGRGPYAPSMTPFAIKLETYLRMAKIPYLNEHDMRPSKKGKYTWIEYNGEEVADSEFCIEYLNKKFEIDLDKNFTPRETGAARAFQKMIEENTYWTGVLDRWIYDKNDSAFKIFKVPFFVRFMFRSNVKKMTHAAGMGRHSQEEVYHIMDQDLKAVSDYLGKNKFLLGDSPCQADCGIFGILANFYWNSFGNQTETSMKKYPNLCDYCERIKERFWPDWDQCITKGLTQKATK